MSKNGQASGYQFGTFQGVFIPSILTILGVVMFLRFGWVLGNVGLVGTLIIVTLACSITFLTALSISELSTNMKVGGGGAYYIISRSLGVEAGAAIGIPLFFAQALGISFYVAGFSEAAADLFPMLSQPVIGVITLVVLSVLAIVSADLALKLQYVIFGLIVLALASFFTGGYENVPLSSDTIVPAKYSFWPVFAIFFPAVTGIEAGLSMSGDLKSPEKSLPWGTLAAVGVSYLIYMMIPVYLHYLQVPASFLLTQNLVMKDVARWGQFILFGVWSAALSSALGALLGAPRTLQALSRDGVVPNWVGRGYGKKNDPRFATLISFIIALAGILLGDLNLIGPILSMFFLTSYSLINFSAAFNGILNNPSWRPKFRVHWTLPLLGTIGCLIVMFMINPGATFIAMFLCTCVYYMMQKRNINAYWGDLRYGILALTARLSIYNLAKLKPHENTWRPNILVLSGSPISRWYLIALADAISHGKGFLTVATILSNQDLDGERINSMQDSIQNYLEDRDVPAIVKVSTSESIMKGVSDLVQNYGFGVLCPNTILLGDVGNAEGFAEYASLILTISSRQLNLVIVKEEDDGQDYRPGQTIDLWWRKVGENSGLMLTLAYQLKTSQEWDGAQLWIKTIVDTEEERAEHIKQVNNFLGEANIDARVEVYLKDDRCPHDIIREESQHSSIVFLGMRIPDDDESVDDYSAYYSQLMTNTDGLPTTVLVLASEQINFNNIYKKS